MNARYIIVKHRNPLALESMVTEKLKNGAALVGGLCVSRDSNQKHILYAQAMAQVEDNVAIEPKR